MQNQKEHWEKVYQTKENTDVSWYQPIPQTSIDFLQEAKTPKNAEIIDIGGGESNFVNYLLAEGYENITVLDISQTAIDHKKEALGESAKKITWIVSNITDFQPNKKYDFWHDRATFHFLIQPTYIEKYTQTIQNNINNNGILVIGTFSETGPVKCSGLEIKQYTEETLSEMVGKHFEKIKCVTTTHNTPFDTTQNFIFCSFKNKYDLR